MRGLILACASSWMGRPSLLIRMVTIAASPPFSIGLVAVTLPTLTPAIRTGEFFAIPFDVWNAARIS